jgi:hypothetical protein
MLSLKIFLAILLISHPLPAIHSYQLIPNSQYSRSIHIYRAHLVSTRYVTMQSEVVVKDHTAPYIPASNDLKIPFSSIKLKINPIQRIKSLITKPFRYIGDKYRKAVSALDEEVPMLKYLWPRDNLKLKIYLILSVVCLFLGKWFTLQVPFAFQRAIDILASSSSAAASNPINNLLSKLGWHSFGFTASIALISYGFSRGLAIALAELKTCLFTNVSQNVCRKFAMDIFERMHTLGKISLSLSSSSSLADQHVSQSVHES